ncbi:WAS/WASL-interacting protein family member 1 [Abeliophyllum distichum]|uniref:WAS/WASL-interacting protein family member 1 n=1 Tax=Abeliophyllum distichum TaxID=126358 RepID=A0ABD1PS87_9LAMI
MAQEEHILRCSFSTGGGGCSNLGGGGDEGGGGVDDGGGGSRSKKIKQKKVPQRGLGVAQLEKIRLEEQQKKEAALQAANNLANNAIGSHSDSTACLAMPCPSVRPNLCSSSNSIPLPPPSPTDLPSPNFLYMSVQSSKNVKVLHPNSVQLSKPLNVGRKEIGLPAILGPGQGNWPRLWNGEQNLEGEKQILDHHRFAFWPRVKFPLPQISHQFQHPSSSTVNVSPGTSSSSVLKFQMEPPSNQIFCDNNYAPLSPKDEKMVGMKRSYPFSLESPTAPSCQCKFQPTYVTSTSRPDESASCSNGCTNHLEPSNKYIREDPPNTSPLPEQNASGVIRENKELNGDFLTLAPPAPATLRLNLKHKHPLAYSGYQEQELTDFGCPSSQAFAKGSIQRPGPSRSMERPTFSFFPTKVQIDQAIIHARNGNGKIGEPVDLSLKL